MKAERKKRRRFPPRSRTSLSLEGPAERFTVELTRPGYQGEAVGRRDDGKVVLVSYGIPGEEVVVEVREEHPSYIVAEVVEVLRASPERVEPRCQHFGACGGCQLQHISYAEQGRIKQGVVADQLRRIGRIIAPPVSGILAAENPWEYRNNARFTVRGEGAIGFTHWHTHRFEPIDQCHIMDSRINDVKKSLEGALTNGERQLAVRIGKQTGDALVHPALDGAGEERGVATGQASYEERIFDVPFRVSAASFFQVNTDQAERMIALVRDRLRLGPGDTLVDAYAGVGTFAALLAPFCGRVIAIEESTAAIRDAAVNLAPFKNVEIIEAKTENALLELDERVNAVILDPPRVGCYPSVLESLQRLQPERIVYVSCDPATLARDLHRLILAGYELTDTTPVDMFPHTYHIESVSTLRRMPGDGFVLASTSDRRREILAAARVPFQALAPASGPEPPPPGPGEPRINPADYAKELALNKARSVSSDAGVPVVGADTVVVASTGEILGKPADAGEARAILRLLREGEHQIITAIAVILPDEGDAIVDHAVTRGMMRNYTDEDIEAYIATGDPFDKAGAYGIQHPEFRPVERLEGCYLNVVGLPLCLLDRLLRQAGVSPQGQPAPTTPGSRCAYCEERTPPELALPA